MRRFINSIFGRAVCNATIVALVLPTLSILTAGKVDAQVQTAPTWAVVDFVCRDKAVGVAAAEAVQSAFGRTPQIDLVPRETVNRTITSLGLQTPVTELTSLLRLAGELRASTIVTGEVKEFRVVNAGGGKKADVIVRVVVRDVASGLPINGSALQASSSIRTGDADDMTVLNEALATAAARAVAEIQSKTLPTATVLNTYDRNILINQGARTGFKVGMELVVTRGREQVATARVVDVEDDSANVEVVRSIKGVQPGDRVRAIFDVPDPLPVIRTDGGITTKGGRKTGGKSEFGTLAMVALVLGVLLSNGRSSGFSPANDVKAEAMMYPNFSGSPAVRLRWRRDLFVRGNSVQVQWQIYRNDVLGTPVLVVPGVSSEGVDDNAATRDITYSDFGGIIGGNTCDTTDLPASEATVAGVVPGRPYTYELALVYRVASIDLPGNGSTGGTGGGGTGGGLTTGEFQTTGTTGVTTTGGTTTAGTTTGGTAGTTGGTQGGTAGAMCYFISRNVAAQGLATPLDRAGLVSPAPNAVISTDVPFTFTSVMNATFPINIEYVLQISSDGNFPKNKSKIYASFVRGPEVGTLSTGSITGLLAKLASDFGASQTEFFWRIGAKNIADKPGPAPDPTTGLRYVFGANRRFTIPAPPPPPPAE